MSEPKTPVTCQHHGESFATFVCQHILHGNGVGFFHGDPADDPRPDAWCASCEKRLHANQGEWNDEIIALADIRLLCAGCYDSVRGRNEVPHRRIKPSTRPTIEDDGWELESAHRQNQLYPKTFNIPRPKELQRLRVGDSVKLLFLFAVTDKHGTKIHCERMWVGITQVTSSGYTGSLDNEPKLSKVLKWRDTIHFQRHHIASIYQEEMARLVQMENQPAGVRQTQQSVNNRYC